MAYQIIYDPEANIAALVDPEAPAALGPIAVGSDGEDPRLPLEEFVNGLDKTPDEMATWPLFNEWAAYVRAIVQLVEDEVEAAETATPEDATSARGGSDAEASEAAPAAPGEATSPPADGTPPGQQPPVTAEEEEAMSERIRQAPGTPAKTGREECWMCHGDLQIDGPQGRVECPVCHGEGTVTAEAPATP